MTARELKELLSTVPDYYQVTIATIDHDDYSSAPIAGRADGQLDHELVLVVEEQFKRERLY